MFILCNVSFAQKNTKALPPYKNPGLATDIRVKDLISKMTLEEKVAQTLCLWTKKKFIFDKNGSFSSKGADTVLKFGIGQIARPNELVYSFQKGSRNAKKTAELCNVIQKYFKEKTRLGIPVMFHEESLHGNQAQDATNFPSHLALTSTWNEELINEVFSSIALEVRSRGAHQVLAPVVDLGRDPRWGRTEETMGEDPYLASRMAVAEINAYQGKDSKNVIGSKNVIATLKHFPVHGTPEGGSNIAPSFFDERTYREINLPPFKAAVVEANALGVMPCYNELSGIPAHANKRLIQDVLRKEWGFNGIVVSDYLAIDELQRFHKISDSKEKSAMLAFGSGVDVELPDKDVYPYLVKLVNEGKVRMSQLDTVVARILTLKFKLGLFENPYVDPAFAEKNVGCDANRAIALKAAEESIVLLKNSQNLLPLDINKYKKIALIGPNADKCILGGYSGEPKQRVTPLEAFKKKMLGKGEILYSEGCKITDRGDWWQDTVKLASKEENLKRIKEAIAVANQSDVIVLCLGGSDATFREAWSLTHMGDLTNLELFGEQNELIKELLKTGKPIVACVFSGPPMTFQYLNNNVNTILNCWFLGQETGTALANIVMGDVNPSGKLAISIPRSVGHLPCYYNYKPSARRGYLFDDVTAMYSFGHGLSYSTFKYSNVRLEKSSIDINESTNLLVDVTNTSNIKGKEVVQMYIRDEISSVTRPIKELKGFEKITLNAGETKTIKIPITYSSLAFYNIDMDYVVEKGDFKVMVGGNSTDLQTVILNVK